MGSRTHHLSTVVQLPRQGRMLAFATSDTCAFLDLSAEMPWGVGERPMTPWRGCYVAIQAEESDVFVVLAKTTGTGIAAAEVSAAADSPQEDVGMMIPAGQTIHAWIEEGAWKYLAYVCRSGETGKIRLWPSSRRELFGLDG